MTQMFTANDLFIMTFSCMNNKLQKDFLQCIVKLQVDPESLKMQSIFESSAVVVFPHVL